MGVSDDQLTGVVFRAGAGRDARGEELVVRKEQDALSLARKAPGGLDGQQGFPASGPAIDDEASGVMEGIEDAALLLGELGELGAGVGEDGVHGGDQVEVAAEEVGELFDTGFVEGVAGRGSLSRAKWARRST